MLIGFLFDCYDDVFHARCCYIVGAVVLACPLGRLLISPPSAVGSSSSSASSSASSVLVPGLAGGLEHGDFDPSAAACHLERGGAVLVINHGG